ncbi:MAG TPA: tetratricopeptide repeat protein [Deltaproteobacteria bacterium]|nr:tetratricopeptide repeat protein [Deltaproteobacteria bacterium]
MAKSTRKELLSPTDEFITATSSLLNWIKENPTRFISIVVVVAVLFISGFGFYSWKTHREDTAMVAFIEAFEDPAKTLEIAQSYANTRAGKLAKLRLARMAYSQGDSAMAVSHAEDFINKWGRQDMFYWNAVLIMSLAYMEQNAFDTSLALLEKCIRNGPDVIRDQALFYKATASISQGKNEEAAEALKTISGWFRDIALVTLPVENTTETQNAE